MYSRRGQRKKRHSYSTMMMERTATATTTTTRRKKRNNKTIMNCAISCYFVMVVVSMKLEAVCVDVCYVAVMVVVRMLRLRIEWQSVRACWPKTKSIFPLFACEDRQRQGIKKVFVMILFVVLLNVFRFDYNSSICEAHCKRLNPPPIAPQADR